MPWNPSLALGAGLIDEQHKKCFKMANQLFEAARNRRTGEYVTRMFQFLENYTKKRFGDEGER